MIKISIALAAVILALTGCGNPATTAPPRALESESKPPAPKPENKPTKVMEGVEDDEGPAPSLYKGPAPLDPVTVQGVADRLGCELKGTGDGTDYRCGSLLISDWSGWFPTDAEVVKSLEQNVRDGLAGAYLYLGNYVSLQGSKRDIAAATQRIG